MCNILSLPAGPQPGALYMTPSPLSVIVPVYNEATFILKILQKVQSNPVVNQIVVVDDFSTDGTRDILRRLRDEPAFAPSQNLNPSKFKILFHEVNQGKGAAIRTGIREVSSLLTIVQDADFEYDPAEYDKLIEPILQGRADVVYGSRFHRDYQGRHMWHTAGNRFLTWVSNLFTGLRLTDMETCYKVMKTEMLKQIPIESNRFGFEPEITAKIAKLKCRVIEVPISYKGRTYAEGKKIGWKDGFSAIATIIRFYLK
jgi:glycosyltransferase involved in cell wall biosynthesis